MIFMTSKLVAIMTVGMPLVLVDNQESGLLTMMQTLFEYGFYSVIIQIIAL